MEQSTNEAISSFDLWREPWIQVESADTALRWASIQEVLRQAHTIQTIYEPSPLVIVGIHRLLTAILQDIYNPQAISDLESLWQIGHFSPEKINAFGQKYSNKFDIFSKTDPFYQTSDLPITPEKISETKTTAYLIPEMPSGSNVIHFTHLNQSDYVLCTNVLPEGLQFYLLLHLPVEQGSNLQSTAFHTIYILPGGKNLFESLALSLITRDFQPKVSDPSETEAWWGKPSIVMKSRKSHVLDISIV